MGRWKFACTLTFVCSVSGWGHFFETTPLIQQPLSQPTRLQTQTIHIAQTTSIPNPPSVLPDQPETTLETTPIPTTTPTPMQCVTRRGEELINASLGQCSNQVMTEAEQWQPDVIVALGGGILPGGRPGCSTTQRAYSSQQLFERMGRRPWLLLSGRGPRRPVHSPDEAEQFCMALREESEPGAHTPAEPHPQHHRRSRRNQTNHLTNNTENNTQTSLVNTQTTNLTNNSTTPAPVLSEAEHMCAVVLRQYPRDQWTDVAGHIILENASMTTRQNVALSTPILVDRGFHRVLVVSTRSLVWRRADNHARRAVTGFRQARPAWRPYVVSGMSCPFEWTGDEWVAFENPPEPHRRRHRERQNPPETAAAHRSARHQPSDATQNPTHRRARK